MPVIQSFHEVRFPLALALGATGGPVRRTEIVTLGSGREQRNARWAQSRRRFDAGQAIQSFDDLHALLSFFEERKGRLFGFRFRDPIDNKSCAPSAAISPLDQALGSGDGLQSVFPLLKSYGAGDQSPRRIFKPVDQSVRVAVNGAEAQAGVDFTVDAAAGTVTFVSGANPGSGLGVTAGYEFDLPVRFDTDEIIVNLAAFAAGDIPSVPLMEILP